MRGRAAVATLCLVALLAAACDRAAPERAVRSARKAPCFPKERVYPPGYTERRFDRFFNEALEVVGDRVSHEGHGCVDEGRMVAVIGVKDLTETDRRRIDALAPRWAKAELFDTKYSMDELRAFGDRAHALLESTGLHISNGQGYYGTRGKVEIYVTKDWIGIEKFLGAVIPPDSFVVKAEGPIELL